MPTSKRPLFLIIILLLIFLVPWLLAYIFYKEGDHWQLKTTQTGQLINPPRDWTQFTFLDSEGLPLMMEQSVKWNFVYVIPNKCEQPCKKTLYYMNQIREATGKDSDRIRLGVITFIDHLHNDVNEMLSKDYSQFVHFYLPQKEWEKVMGGLPSTPISTSAGYLYLVDPHGNIMMAYPTTANPSGMFKDIQKLLKVSQIG